MLRLYDIYFRIDNELVKNHGYTRKKGYGAGLLKIQKLRSNQSILLKTDNI